MVYAALLFWRITCKIVVVLVNRTEPYTKTNYGFRQMLRRVLSAPMNNARRLRSRIRPWTPITLMAHSGGSSYLAKMALMSESALFESLQGWPNMCSRMY